MTNPKRPKTPSYLSPSPPVPERGEPDGVTAPAGEEERPDPTRYGDWEKNGIAVDF